MSTASVATVFSCGRILNIPLDEIVPQGSVQATAWGIKRSCRVNGAALNAGLILPSLLTGEAEAPIVVVNDSAQSIKVYPALGEKINGTLNTAVTLTTGQVIVLFPDFNFLGGTVDWRGAAIS
jgi:hypothetical protein